MNELNEDRMEEAYDEGELSDDEFEELSYDDWLDRVESNDPSLTSVLISTLILIPNDDADRRLVERLSTAISRNTQLKAVRLNGYGVQINEARAVNLFRGIACNQSIKRLHFYNCGGYVGDICRTLTPLFKNNQVERMIFHSCKLSIEGTRLLATSLAMFDSLKEFALTKARIQQIPQEVARDLMQSLSGHSGLRKLDLSYPTVGKLGCSALVDLLNNPNINLKVLDLAYNRLGDAEAAALASGMAGNVSLKEINLTGNMGITEVGWQALFDPLRNSSCRLERITLDNNGITDAAAQSLSNALASNTTLKTLNLHYNWHITPTGWRVLFQAIRSPNCALEDVDLSANRLNDEVMTSLADVLQSNRSLKSLIFSSNDEVTEDGWQIFFSTVLTNPSSGLEKLDLCDMDDAAILALTNALVNNSTLKVLNLSGNYQITNAGWDMFSSVLQSPNTALEELDLDENEINDSTITSLLNSLAGNKKLKELNFIHSADWSPPLSVLCNADSIMDTYNSNHTLEKVGDEGDDLPEEFESLLQINRENNPSQAARLKIIKTHFKEGFITQPFVGMDLNVLPYAMAWMGRDGEVSNHFYGFIRSRASLFKNTPDEEK